MRKSRVILLGLAGAAILPTLAGATEQDVNLSANVAGFCLFTAAPTITAQTNISPGALTPTSSTISIFDPTNGSGFMNAWKFTLKIDGTCNKVSELKLFSENGGLKDPVHGGGPPAPGFVNRFDYFASVDFDGAGPVSIPTTSGVPISSSPAPELTTGPFSGIATLHVTGVPNSGGPVMAGSYSDTLTLSLIPQ